MTQKRYFPPQTSGQRRFSSWQPPSRNSARRGTKIDHKLPKHTDKSTNQASFFQRIERYHTKTPQPLNRFNQLLMGGE